MSAGELGVSLAQIRRLTREAFPIYEYIGLEILDSEPPVGRCRAALGVATANFEVEITITTDAGPVARASGRYHLRENEV